MTLQRCPNCYGPPKLHKKKSNSWRFWYECGGDCWTQTDKHSTPEAAAAEWNSLKPRKKETPTCPNCGHELDARYNYCPSCGYKTELENEE